MDPFNVLNTLLLIPHLGLISYTVFTLIHYILGNCNYTIFSVNCGFNFNY